VSTGRASERASEQSKGASEACEVRSDTRELWCGASCPPPLRPLGCTSFYPSVLLSPYSGRYFYPQAPATNRWVISVSVDYWFSIQRILASYPKLFLCCDPGEHCHLSFPSPRPGPPPYSLSSGSTSILPGDSVSFALALKLPTFKAPSWGNVNDTFPCWSLLWATVTQHPPAHHPSTGCPLFLRCEWTSNWVNIWLHLSNQFCRK